VAGRNIVKNCQRQNECHRARGAPAQLRQNDIGRWHIATVRLQPFDFSEKMTARLRRQLRDILAHLVSLDFMLRHANPRSVDIPDCKGVLAHRGPGRSPAPQESAHPSRIFSQGL
jgi:hypothetical protein